MKGLLWATVTRGRLLATRIIHKFRRGQKWRRADSPPFEGGVWRLAILPRREGLAGEEKSDYAAGWQSESEILWMLAS